MSEEYHREEFRIAADAKHPAHLLPPVASESARILDIGCGAGQTLTAAYPGRSAFGLDCDLGALEFGRTRNQRIRFACGLAEALPFREASFDLVLARVSLAYTNIPVSVREIRRVLRKGGAVWITLHPFSLCWQQAKRANLRGRLFFCYIVLNSLSLHLLQRQFRFFGRQESFQTEKGVVRVLAAAGFREIKIERGEHFLVTARA